MKQIQKLGNWRQLLSRAMGWLHCALIYALFYGTAYRFLEGDSALPGRMWWGLLSILPLAAADMGTQVCGKLVLYLPCSLACCGRQGQDGDTRRRPCPWRWCAFSGGRTASRRSRWSP